MPRAFLITHRRYNTVVEYEHRESSPERCVSVAEPARVRGCELPALHGVSSDCPEELYNLTQLAEVSLAAAAGRLFSHRPYLPGGGVYLEDSSSDRSDHSDVAHARRPCSPHCCEASRHWDVLGNADDPEGDGELGEGVAGGVEAHGCPDCGKRYSTSSNLARHRQTHRSLGDKKARRCPHCDKVYVSMPAFSMHVRTHNQGCKCPFCGKCFSRPWLLQGHIRTHTGEKPFKCLICTKAFADKSNLRAHVQTHSNTKPHVCTRCGKAFALKSYLYKHEESSCMRALHGPPSAIPMGARVLGLPIAV